MSGKPPWCKEKCTASPGYDFCYVDHWIITGWLGHSKRNILKKEELRKEFSELTSEELVRRCINIQFGKT